MSLLPRTNPLGILGVAEIIPVLRLGQPGPLKLTLSGLAALRFEAKALPLSATAIGKKKFIAVQALASVIGRLHRFQNQ